MESRLEPRHYASAPAVRLAALERDLGIGGDQRVAWEAFVETFRSVARSLRCESTRVLAQDRVPPITEALRAHSRRLAAEMVATNRLNAIIDNLYQSLTPRQKMCADRFLAVLCCKLGWEVRATH
jgi:hypothetical protein